MAAIPTRSYLYPHENNYIDATVPTKVKIDPKYCDSTCRCESAPKPKAAREQRRAQKKAFEKFYRKAKWKRR